MLAAKPGFLAPSTRLVSVPSRIGAVSIPRFPFAACRNSSVPRATAVQPTAEVHAARPSLPQQITSVLTKAAAYVGIAATLFIGFAGNAFAANSSGRVGGSGFSHHHASRAQSRAQSRAISRSSSHTTTHSTFHVGSSYGWSTPAVFLPVVPFSGYGHSSGGSMLSTILAMALVTLIAIQLFWMFSSSSSGADDREYAVEPPVTVARVQVGLLAVAHHIKADLHQLALRANTGSPEGLHLVMQETVLALLRNPSYCVYGASSSKVVASSEEAERLFNAMSIEERAKIPEETLSNYGGMTRTRTMTKAPGGVSELIVVTLMVAAEGAIQIPDINSQAALRDALSKLGGVSPSSVMAVEVLWTPQADNDALTQQECMITFPTLAPL